MKTIFQLRNLFLFQILGFLLLISCEERTEWEFDTKNQKYIVVEGLITNEMINHQIKISESVSELNAKPVPVSGATVHVLEGTTIRVFKENPDCSGIYQSLEKFTGVINKPYVLIIKIKNRLFTANTHMIPVTPIDTLNYTLNTSTNQYYIKNVASNFNSYESNMYEIKIDRSKAPGYENIPYEAAQSLLYFYTLQTLDVNEIFAPKKEIVYFPAGTQIVERKYSLIPRHVEFIRSLLSETESRGGFFDVTQDNVRTNLSEGAVGYFAACSVVSDTILVN